MHDPTLGVCWDADRVNLWRVGIRPDTFRLSTAAAKGPDRLVQERDRPKPPDWPDLYAAYARLITTG